MGNDSCEEGNHTALKFIKSVRSNSGCLGSELFEYVNRFKIQLRAGQEKVITCRKSQLRISLLAHLFAPVRLEGIEEAGGTHIL